MSLSARNFVVLAGSAAFRWRSGFERIRRATGLPPGGEMLLLGAGAADDPASRPAGGPRVWTLDLPSAGPAEGDGPLASLPAEADASLRRRLFEIVQAMKSEGATRPVRMIVAADGTSADSLPLLPALFARAAELAFENALPFSAGLVLALDPATDPPPALAPLFERLEEKVGGATGDSRLADEVLLVAPPESADDGAGVALVALGFLLRRGEEASGSTLGRPHLYRTARTTRIGLDAAALYDVGTRRFLAAVRDKVAGGGEPRDADFHSGYAAGLANRLGLMKAVIPSTMSAEDLVGRQPNEFVRTPLPQRISGDVDFHIKKLQLDFKVAAEAVADLDAKVANLAEDFLERGISGGKGPKFSERIVQALIHGALRGEYAPVEISHIARALRAWAADQFAETLALELSGRASELKSQRENHVQGLWSAMEKSAKAGADSPSAGTGGPDYARQLARIRTIMNQELQTLRAVAAVKYSHEVLGRLSKAVREADKRIAAIREAVAAFPVAPPAWESAAEDSSSLRPDSELTERLERALSSAVRTIVDANRRLTSPEGRGDRESFSSPLPSFLDFPDIGAAEVEARARKAADAALAEALGGESILPRLPEARSRWVGERELPFELAVDDARVSEGEAAGLLEATPPTWLVSSKLAPVLAGWGGAEPAQQVSISNPNALFRVVWSPPLPAAAFSLFAPFLGASRAFPLSLVERFRARVMELAWQAGDPATLLGVVRAFDQVATRLGAGQPVEAAMEADALVPAFDGLGLPAGDDPFDTARFLLRLAAALDLGTLATVLPDSASAAAALPPEDDALRSLLASLRESAAPLSRLLQVRDAVERTSRLDEVGRRLRDLAADARKRIVGPTRTLVVSLLERMLALVDEEKQQWVGRVELAVVLEVRKVKAAGEFPLLVAVENRGRFASGEITVELVAGAQLRAAGDPVRRLPGLAAGDRAPLRFPARPSGTGAIPVEIAWEAMDLAGTKISGRLRETVEIVGEPAGFRPVDRNPYVAGPPVKSKEMFFGRDDVFEFISENLRGRYQDNIVIIHGHRRTGKSSILYRLAAETDRWLPGYRAVLFDVEGLGKFTTSSFLGSLARRLAKEVPESAGLPEVSREEFGGDPFAAFDAFLDRLERAWPGGEKLLIMMDEFELIEEKVREKAVDRELFSYLRSLMQHRDRLGFLLAGTQRLVEMKEDYWSALFSLAQYRRVSFLSAVETRRLVNEPLSGAVTFDDLAVDAIHRLTAGHPYYVQLLCHAVIARMNAEGRTNFLATEEVKAVLDEILDLGAGQFRFDLGRAGDRLSRRILGALADLDGVGVERTPVATLTKEVQARSPERLRDDEIPRAIASLVDADLLEGDKERSAVRFKIDLLRLWLRTSVGALALDEGSA